MAGLQQTSCEERQREVGLVSLEKAQGDLTSTCKELVRNSKEESCALLSGSQWQDKRQ